MLRSLELTQAQYEYIAPCLPVQCGNVSLSNLQVLNAILHVAEHGCKWGTPIYTRMNRWSENGVLDRVFERLQRERLVRVKLEVASLDSTIVKVHTDGTGARKKRPPSHRQAPRQLDHQDSQGCRGCSNRPHLPALAGPEARRAAGTRTAEAPLAGRMAAPVWSWTGPTTRRANRSWSDSVNRH